MDQRKRSEDPEGADFLDARVPRKWRDVAKWIAAIAGGIMMALGAIQKVSFDQAVPQKIETIVAERVAAQCSELKKDLDDQAVQIAEIAQICREISRNTRKIETNSEIRREEIISGLDNIASEIQSKLKKR